MGLPSKLVELNRQIAAIRASGSFAELPAIDIYAHNRMVKLKLVHGVNIKPLGTAAFPFLEEW